MTIRTRVLLVLLTLFALYGAADYAIRAQLIWPSFQAWERQTAASAAQRFEQRLQQELDSLDQLALNWARKDATYRFAQGRQTDYPSTHLPTGTLASADIDLMALYDQKGRRLFNRSVPGLSGEQLEQLAPAQLSDIHRLRQFSSVRPLTAQRLGGTLITTGGPWLLAARPIFTDSDSGQATGIVVVGRQLSTARVDQYARELAIPLSIRWQRSVAPIEGSGFAHHNGETGYREHAGLRLQASHTLVAADGNGRLELKAVISRELMQRSYQQAQRAWIATAGLGLLLVLIIGVLLHHSIVRPIRYLSQLMLRVVEKGDYSLRPQLKRRDEIGQLSAAFEALLNRIEGQNAAKQMQQHRLQKLAGTDALTGVANRRALEEYLQKCWGRSRQQQLSVSVILCDIDHFKRYNDHYGHLQGDNCLQRVSQVMTQHIHRPGDQLFRYGGEEFAVVLPNSNLDGATQLAEKLRRAVFHSQIEHSQSGSGVVTLSLGVASAIGNHNPPKLLIDAADRALYEAKESGRNRVMTGRPITVPHSAANPDLQSDSESA